MRYLNAVKQRVMTGGSLIKIKIRIVITTKQGATKRTLFLFIILFNDLVAIYKSLFVLTITLLSDIML